MKIDWGAKKNTKKKPLKWWKSVRLWSTNSYLGEQPPPLPVPEFKVGNAVPLNHSQGRLLLLSPSEGSRDTEENNSSLSLLSSSLSSSTITTITINNKYVKEEKNRFSTGSIQQHLLAGQISSATGLEADDDVGDLHVSLLLQVGQDTGSEEDFALTNAVKVGVQLQSFDLQWQTTGQVREVWRGASVLQAAASTVRTMSSQACLPSMKPFGMALGVRISYLKEGRAERNYSTDLTQDFEFCHLYYL